MEVIKVENLYKQYRLGQVSTGSIAHDLNRWWHTVRGKEDPYEKITGVNNREDSGSNDYVWALQDINFSVKQGEVLGIIGRNGAGKSTLLKILSKVTSPTKGNIKVRGRIASLLEVGTGFHPELTGRENIFLNGAILGMTKSEIRSKFDEIVAFSGVEKYIDTPVKRYSSGMYVRLAFAVAAHLEPEILIVDEVLAVGDAEFQKKCLGKMKDVSGEGRTVLFVSHNMAAVKSLCNKSIHIASGKIMAFDDTSHVIGRYLRGNSENIFGRDFSQIKLESVFQLHRIYLSNNELGEPNEIISENEELVLHTIIEIFSEKPEKYHLTYHLVNDIGEGLFSFSNSDIENLKSGMNHLTTIFPKNFFQSGNFSIHFFFVEDKAKSIFVEKDIIHFTVIDAERNLGEYMGREPGFIKPLLVWKKK
ncbi:MAG: ABC transporter ATP-binding protein [Bacteroidetes bacterium]|nr:ABC transporter ATP-binding protein [Bacteroidota bacterium]